MMERRRWKDLVACLVAALFMVTAGRVPNAWGADKTRATHAPETPTLSVPQGRVDFCRYYSKALQVTAADERKKLSLEIYNSRLLYVEKAWLLYTLCDIRALTRDGKDVEAIAGGGQTTLSGVNRGQRAGKLDIDATDTSDYKFAKAFEDAGIPMATTSAFDTGIEILYDIKINSAGRLRLMTTEAQLMLFKDATVPQGVYRFYDGPAEEVVVPEMAGKVAESSDTVAGPADVEAVLHDPRAGEFATCYLNACRAASEKEKMQVGKALTSSKLSTDEEAFIGFTMLSPGMTIAAAKSVSGIGGRWMDEGLSDRTLTVTLGGGHLVLDDLKAPLLPSAAAPMGIIVLQRSSEPSPTIVAVKLQLGRWVDPSMTGFTL